MEITIQGMRLSTMAWYLFVSASWCSIPCVIAQDSLHQYLKIWCQPAPVTNLMATESSLIKTAELSQYLCHRQEHVVRMMLLISDCGQSCWRLVVRLITYCLMDGRKLVKVLKRRIVKAIGELKEQAVRFIYVYSSEVSACKKNWRLLP